MPYSAQFDSPADADLFNASIDAALALQAEPTYDRALVSASAQAAHVDAERRRFERLIWNTAPR